LYAYPPPLAAALPAAAIPAQGVARPSRTSSSREANTTSVFNEENDPHGIALKEYLIKVEEYTRLNIQFDADKSKVYGLLMQDRYMSEDSREVLGLDEEEWEEIESSQCPVRLLNRIFSTHPGGMTTIQTAEDARQNVRAQYNLLKQSAHETLVNFKKRYENAIKALQLYDVPAPTQPDQVYDFISKLDSVRFGEFQQRMRNKLAEGDSGYPINLADSVSRAKVFRPKSGTAPQTRAVFAVASEKPKSGKGPKLVKEPPIVTQDMVDTSREALPERNKRPKPYDYPCTLGCGGNHPAHLCPLLSVAKKAVEAQAKKVHFTRSFRDDDDHFGVFMTNGGTKPLTLTADHILLDNQAESHIFRNPKILNNLRSTPKTKYGGLTSGGIHSYCAGNFLNLSDVDVAVHTDVTANILSISNLRDLGHDCGEDKETDSYYWNLPCGYRLKFKRLNGFYALDYKSIPYYVRENANPKVYLTSVLENRTKYTKRENDQADLSVEVRKRFGFPNAQAYIKQVRSVIKNVPVDAHDAVRMFDIHGEATEFIRGKMRKKNAKNADYNPIPREISSSISLHIDIMYAYGLAFLLGVATPIGVATIVYLGNAKDPDKFKKQKSGPGPGLGTRATASIKAAVDAILRRFGAYGFYCKHIFSDREKGILALQDKYPGIPFDPTGTGGHEPVVENRIRTIKGTMRAVKASLPYNLCATLCVWLALYAVYVGNRIPVRGGYEAAPISLVTGRQPDYKSDFPFAFGDEAWVKTQTSSSDDERAALAVALLPSGSLTGSAQFMLLTNGAIVTTHNYKLHPYSQIFIDTLNNMHRDYPPPSEDITMRVGVHEIDEGEHDLRTTSPSIYRELTSRLLQYCYRSG
jgi:hypothetical protein